MKNLSEHLNDVLEYRQSNTGYNYNSPEHKACVKTLLANGFAQGKYHTITRDGEAYVVRAHRMPQTQFGKAIIVDTLDLGEGRYQNMIFISPEVDDPYFYIAKRAELNEFIHKNQRNNRMMHVTSREEDDKNPGKTSCMTVTIKYLEDQDWFKTETL